MLAETLKAVKAYDFGQSRVSLLDMDREIRVVLGHAEHLAALEEALLEILKSDSSLAAKRYVCQKLGVIGTERSVTALAAIVTDAEKSDMARYALERIPLPSVNKVLRDAVAKTQANVKVGVINSLGVRKDAEAVPQLGRLLADTDPGIAAASAWALGQIGGPTAAGLLIGAKDSSGGQVRVAILHACLACAEGLKTNGRKSEASALYDKLTAESMPLVIRRAAGRGLANAKS